MKGEIGVAVIGTGWMGRWYCRNSHHLQNVALRAVADADSTSVEETARAWSVPGYTDYHDILARHDIDVVVIATPPASHRVIIEDVASAGIKNVICEKPIGTDLADATAIRAIVRRSGLLFMVNFMERFNSAVVEARDCLERGTVGRPVLIKSCVRLNRRKLLRGGLNHWLFDQRVGGGPIKEMLIHNFDLMRWLTGAEAREVYGKGGAFCEAFADHRKMPLFLDNVAAIFEMNDGTMALADGSFTAPQNGPGFDFRMEIVGSEGIINLDCTGHPLAIFSEREGIYYPEPLRQSLLGGSYLNSFRHYIDCVRAQKLLPPAATIDDAWLAQEMSEGWYRSIAEGKVVRFPLDKPATN